MPHLAYRVLNQVGTANLEVEEDILCVWDCIGVMPLIRQTSLPVCRLKSSLQAHPCVKITYLGHHEHLVLGIVFQDGFFSGETQNERVVAIRKAVFIQENCNVLLGMWHQGILTARNCD